MARKPVDQINLVDLVESVFQVIGLQQRHGINDDTPSIVPVTDAYFDDLIQSRWIDIFVLAVMGYNHLTENIEYDYSDSELILSGTKRTAFEIHIIKKSAFYWSPEGKFVRK